MKTKKATEEIWRAFHRRLRVFIAKRARNPDDADEILQEAFERIHRRLGSLREPDRLAPWVFRIVRNTMIDYYRKAARRRELPSDLGEGTDIKGIEFGERPDSEADRSDYRRELAACLGPMIRRLPERYREALTMTELKERTEKDAARHLSLSLPGLKSRVQRGRRKLKAMLEACCRIELDRRKGIAGYEVKDSNCRSCKD